MKMFRKFMEFLKKELLEGLKYVPSH